MSEPAAIADAVLITLHPVPSGAQMPVVLGRSVPERQVEFAASLGCRRVFLLDGGGSRESFAARHMAEEMGMKVQEISTPHALVHSIRNGEMLLVLQADLLPGWMDWPGGAGRDEGEVLVLPADTGVKAGFERIDLSRAWSGALLVSQPLLDRLLDLPEDVDAAPALLRIALQARVPETLLDDARLNDGSWALLGPDADGAAVEDAWLTSRFQPAGDDRLSRRIALRCLRHFGGSLAKRGGVVAGAVAGVLALLGGAIAASFHGFAAAGFGLVALAALAVEMTIGIRDLQAKPGEGQGQWPRLRLLVDAALVICGFLALEGAWFRRAFPPLIMLAALHVGAGGKSGWKDWRGGLILDRLAFDRMTIAATVALMGAVAPIDAGIMLVTLLLLALAMPGGRADRH